MSDATAAPAGAGEVVAADLLHIETHAADELQALEGKRVLLLGGGGFLGYYLAQVIALHGDDGATGIDLTIADNWSRGTPDWIEALRGRTNVDVITHDVTETLPSSLGHHDWIIHAASIASPTFYREHPLATMDANVGGLRNVLDHAVAESAAGRPLDGILFFSTSEIYGDPDPASIPTPETYRGNVSCTGPRACYDESKCYGETLCTVFAAEHGVPVRIARPFNNYGPGLKISDRRVIPDFARNILDGDDIELLSSGAPTRTFCYIADAIVGYLKILVRGRDGEPYNIGIDEPEVSMSHLADELVRTAHDLFGYDGQVVRRTSDDPAYLVDNPNRRCPDLTKSRSELDYRPSIDLDEGLRRTLLWYREHAQGEDR